MQTTPEFFICRILILYAILHIVALIKDVYKYKTSIYNGKYFWKNMSIVVVLLEVDIVAMGLFMCTSFLLYGDFFYLFSLIINKL